MLILSHASCSDGLGAAWIFHDLFRDKPANEVRYVFSAYGDPVPEFEPGETIIICDFSYPGDVLEELCQKAANVTVLDHHLSACRDLEAYFKDRPLPANLDLKIRMDQSGVGMVWEHVYRDKPLPPILAAIQDRDLWKFEVANTKEITSAMGLYPMEFSSLDNFMAMELSQVVEIGKVVLQRNQQIIDFHLENAVRIIEFEGMRVPVCNTPPLFASELGNRMLGNGRHLFSITYFDMEDRRQWSLRGGGMTDVSLIAKKYGGGGHKSAAGFTTSIGVMPEDLQPVTTNPV